MTAGLDRYRLEEVIGVGSFATVHRAVDTLLDDTVVVKLLAENHSLNPEVRERFIGEGRSLRKVVGPHVVSVHDIGESPRQQPYLVLEHADRGSLAERVDQLRATGWIPGDQDLLAVARPLAAALDAVHRAQLVHRDLSPRNLLLTSSVPEPNPTLPAPASSRLTEATDRPAKTVTAEERLLLADLGMCKDLALNSGLTVSGGTSGFRPPEQAGPGVVDTRADIWAATALLAWLGEGAQLPSAFTRFLRHGMQAKPARRPQTILAWLAELEDALSPPPEPETRTTPTTPIVPADQPAPPRRWGLLAGIGAALTALALVIGVLVGMSLSDDEPVSSVDGVSISISGPSEVSVGEAATFTAEATGVDSWVWTLPSGSYRTDDREATVTATSPGTTLVVLRAQTPDGQELETRHPVRVVE